MATLAQLAAGLQTRLATISGLRAEDYWPSSLNPPVGIALVWPMQRATLGGDRIYGFIIELIVSVADVERAQASIYGYMDVSGTNSILAAIEAGDTLGGLAAFTQTDEPGQGWARPELREIPPGSGKVYMAATLTGSIWVAI